MMNINTSKRLLLGFLLAILSTATNAQECDPLTELQKQTDATMSVAAWSSLGLINYLPKTGITLFMPSDKALTNLMKIMGASKGSKPLKETLKTLPPLLQAKLISVFINHIMYTPRSTLENGGGDVSVPTALSLAHPGYALTFSDNGKVVKTPANQIVKIGDPRSACGNLVYVCPQILMPANLLALPDTSLEQALAIGRQMAAGAAAQ